MWEITYIIYILYHSHRWLLSFVNLVYGFHFTCIIKKGWSTVYCFSHSNARYPQCQVDSIELVLLFTQWKGKLRPILYSHCGAGWFVWRQTRDSHAMHCASKPPPHMTSQKHNISRDRKWTGFFFRSTRWTTKFTHVHRPSYLVRNAIWIAPTHSRTHTLAQAPAV